MRLLDDYMSEIEKTIPDRTVRDRLGVGDNWSVYLDCNMGYVFDFLFNNEDYESKPDMQSHRGGDKLFYFRKGRVFVSLYDYSKYRDDPNSELAGYRTKIMLNFNSHYSREQLKEIIDEDKSNGIDMKNKYYIHFKDAVLDICRYVKDRNIPAYFEYSFGNEYWASLTGDIGQSKGSVKDYSRMVFHNSEGKCAHEKNLQEEANDTFGKKVEEFKECVKNNPDYTLKLPGGVIITHPKQKEEKKEKQKESLIKNLMGFFYKR